MICRVALIKDSEAIRAIYNAEVLGSTATLDMLERTVEDQALWMAEHDGPHCAVVAEDESQVVGFGSLSPFRDRPGYSSTVEDSVYVAPSHRGRGAGRLILGELVRLGGAHGFHSIIARIGGGGEPSIALHKTCGFEIVGIENQVGRKHGKWISVTVMQKML